MFQHVGFCSISKSLGGVKRSLGQKWALTFESSYEFSDGIINRHLAAQQACAWKMKPLLCPTQKFAQPKSFHHPKPSFKKRFEVESVKSKM